MSFTNVEASKIISVSSNLVFTLSAASASWCIPTLQANDVKVQVEANTQPATRISTFKLFAKDNKTQTITVQQLGMNPSVIVKEKNIYLEDYKRIFTLEVTANVLPTIELPTWIKPVNFTPVVGSQIYTFEADELTVESTRTENIVVKVTGGVSVDVPITQKFNGYVSFAVISDTHFGNSKGEGPMVKVPKALKILHPISRWMLSLW
ncbi:MAG: hypothetical protein QM751_10280 [Paludibacteraceae bacterium]